MLFDTRFAKRWIQSVFCLLSIISFFINSVFSYAFSSPCFQYGYLLPRTGNDPVSFPCKRREIQTDRLYLRVPPAFMCFQNSPPGVDTVNLVFATNSEDAIREKATVIFVNSGLPIIFSDLS